MIIVYYDNYDNEDDIVLWCVKLDKYSETSITTTALKISSIDNKHCQSRLSVPPSYPGLSTEGRATNTVLWQVSDLRCLFSKKAMKRYT